MKKNNLLILFRLIKTRKLKDALCFSEQNFFLKNYYLKYSHMDLKISSLLIIKFAEEYIIKKIKKEYSNRALIEEYLDYQNLDIKFINGKISETELEKSRIQKLIDIITKIKYEK